MGRKRAGKRERFFFYLAGVLIGALILGGCVTKETPLLITESQDLMVRGDYSRALGKNRQLLEKDPRMGDQALFQMGLISAHPKNPDRDYKKSLRYFQRIIKEYPNSDLKSETQVWIWSLQEAIEKDKKINDLQRQIEKLKEIDLGIQEKKKKSLP
jgi:tetratricopeptide (TPR) repeat protein